MRITESGLMVEVFRLFLKMPFATKHLCKFYYALVIWKIVTVNNFLRLGNKHL